LGYDRRAVIGHHDDLHSVWERELENAIILRLRAKRSKQGDRRDATRQNLETSRDWHEAWLALYAGGGARRTANGLKPD
jgi:hypothetical protein